MQKQSVAGSNLVDEQEEDAVNPWIDLSDASAFFENDEVRSLKDRAVEFARAGVPVHLSGPAGLGKTSVCFQIAQALGRPVSLMTGNAWLASPDFVGGAIGATTSTVVDRYVQSVRRTENRSRMDWNSSILSQAMEQGHTLIYDEFTRASPEANSALLSVLEEGLLVCTDPTSPKRHVRADARFRVLLTSNPHDYVAVNSAPDALMDRVVTLPMQEYTGDTLARIVSHKSGISVQLAHRIVSFLTHARASTSNMKFSILRVACMVGRVAALRARKTPPNTKDIVDLTVEVLRGRGVDVSVESIDEAMKHSQAA